MFESHRGWTRGTPRGGFGHERPALGSPEVPHRTHFQLDAAIALAVFAAALGLLALGEVDPGAWAWVAAVLLTALASLPLVARRNAPLAVFVLTSLASIALRGFAQPIGPPLGPTMALYWVAAVGDGSRARMRAALALAAGLLLAHYGAARLRDGDLPATESLLGVLLWGGAWLAGERTRLRRERMAELEERALRAEREAERERRLATAEERTRIARDLHDSAGHAINVILVHAGMGRLQNERDPEGARKAFETIEAVARETVTEIDQMVRVLRDDATDSRDDVEPPAGLAALPGLVERHRAAGLEVKSAVRGEPRQVPSRVDRGAYRILQEALTNAARHGNGNAEVEIVFRNGVLEVRVANALRRDGTAKRAGSGHGLTGMRERAALLGGSLEAGADDRSFRVRAHLPLSERPA